MKKCIVFDIMLLSLGALLIFALSACAVDKFSIQDKGNLPQGNSLWETAVPIPFEGYICGYEESKALLQIPMVFSKGASEEILDEIRSIHVWGNGQKMEGVDYSLQASPPSSDYELLTFSFNVLLPKQGDYTLDSYEILLDSNKTVTGPLNNIHLQVESLSDIDINTGFEAKMSNINQADQTQFQIGYINHSDEDVRITGFSFDKRMFTRVIKIDEYLDFNLSKKDKENDLICPTGEERTFVFTLEPNDSFFNRDNVYFYDLPFLYYEQSGASYRMLAQYQPIIIDAPFDDAYCNQLVQETPRTVKAVA